MRGGLTCGGPVGTFCFVVSLEASAPVFALANEVSDFGRSGLASSRQRGPRKSAGLAFLGGALGGTTLFRSPTDSSINTRGVGTCNIGASKAGLVTPQKRAVGTRDLARACSGGKFLVSRTGDAYDAQARNPNRKFRFNAEIGNSR